MGAFPAKGLAHMVLAQMSKNPLTVQQEARIKLRYGNRAIITAQAISVNAKTIPEGGSNEE